MNKGGKIVLAKINARELLGIDFDETDLLLR